MSSQITRKLFTIDDCDKMAEVGILSPDERTELINGEILIVPPPGPRHGSSSTVLTKRSLNLFKGRRLSASRAEWCCTNSLRRCPISCS